MRFTTLTSLAAVALASTATAGLAQTREQIRIVGSSTVFPFTQAVAEQYANATGNPAPVVESTGTGGGFKVFCGGLGVDFPDVTGASRAMKESEYKACQDAGVTSISEILIGYDGLSLAHSSAAPDFGLTKAQIWLALAAKVPVNGALADNPYKMWNEIDPSLPAAPITVFGPPPTSGTRDAFVELVMDVGCKEFPEVKALEGDAHKEACQRMRQDGPFIEAGENDNLIVQRLQADANAVGIFGFSFLYENQDKLKDVAVDGIEASEETIADGSYPVSRPLYIYVKNQHRGVIPGLDEFLAAYTSEDAIGADGYLAERGLIPLSAERAAEMRAIAADATPMKPLGM